VDETIVEAVLKALRAKLGTRVTACPLCGGLKWGMEKGFVNLRVDPEITSSLVVGGPVYPVVLLTCKECGETRMVNINVLLGPEGLQELERVKKGGNIARKALES
jgi:hypothetical protein